MPWRSRSSETEHSITAPEVECDHAILEDDESWHEDDGTSSSSSTEHSINAPEVKSEFTMLEDDESWREDDVTLSSSSSSSSSDESINSSRYNSERTLSAYEEFRLKRIKRNEAHLAKLGLLKEKKKMKQQQSPSSAIILPLPPCNNIPSSRGSRTKITSGTLFATFATPLQPKPKPKSDSRALGLSVVCRKRRRSLITNDPMDSLALVTSLQVARPKFSRSKGRSLPRNRTKVVGGENKLLEENDVDRIKQIESEKKTKDISRQEDGEKQKKTIEGKGFGKKKALPLAKNRKNISSERNEQFLSKKLTKGKDASDKKQDPTLVENRRRIQSQRKRQLSKKSTEGNDSAKKRILMSARNRKRINSERNKQIKNAMKGNGTSRKRGRPSAINTKSSLTEILPRRSRYDPPPLKKGNEACNEVESDHTIEENVDDDDDSWHEEDESSISIKSEESTTSDEAEFDCAMGGYNSLSDSSLYNQNKPGDGENNEGTSYPSFAGIRQHLEGRSLRTPTQKRTIAKSHKYKRVSNGTVKRSLTSVLEADRNSHHIVTPSPKKQGKSTSSAPSVDVRTEVTSQRFLISDKDGTSVRSANTKGNHSPLSDAGSDHATEDDDDSSISERSSTLLIVRTKKPKVNIESIKFGKRTVPTQKIAEPGKSKKEKVNPVRNEVYQNNKNMRKEKIPRKQNPNITIDGYLICSSADEKSSSSTILEKESTKPIPMVVTIKNTGDAQVQSGKNCNVEILSKKRMALVNLIDKMMEDMQMLKDQIRKSKDEDVVDAKKLGKEFTALTRENIFVDHFFEKKSVKRPHTTLLAKSDKVSTVPTLKHKSSLKKQLRMDDMWYNHLADLKKFKERHGTIFAEVISGDLGDWFRAQRRYYSMYRKGEDVPLTKEMIKALEAEFIWSEENKNRKGEPSSLITLAKVSGVILDGSTSGVDLGANPLKVRPLSVPVPNQKAKEWDEESECSYDSVIDLGTISDSRALVRLSERQASSYSDDDDDNTSSASSRYDSAVRNGSIKSKSRLNTSSDILATLLSMGKNKSIEQRDKKLAEKANRTVESTKSFELSFHSKKDAIPNATRQMEALRKTDWDEGLEYDDQIEQDLQSLPEADQTPMKNTGKNKKTETSDCSISDDDSSLDDLLMGIPMVPY